MKRKQLWTGTGICIGMLVLILDGKTALEGARQGVVLCLKTVVPSLFPFFVLSILLTSSLLGSSLPLLRPLGRLFGIPEGAESLLIPAFLGGYPVGAQSAAAAFRSGQLSKQEAERLLSFCNNAGPAFLFGMAASMFPRRWMAWALWGVHIGGALFAALLIPGSGKRSVKMTQSDPPSLTSALNTSIRVMASVCGWVVLFRVILAFLSRWILWILPTAVQVAVTGFLELSNGSCELLSVSDVSARLCICSAILAFGGLCVTMQTLSVTAGLSLRQYFLGKLLQTVFSLALTVLIAYGIWLPFGALFLAALVLKLQKKSSIPSASGV
ncbi:MAG: hypothetical protein ACI3V5_03355 [Faecousia sp.]